MRKVPKIEKSRPHHTIKCIKRAIEEKRFYCPNCELACASGYQLKNHLLTKKHKKMKELFPNNQ